MVLSFSTEVMNGPCSEDQLELLDAIDRLRLQAPSFVPPNDHERSEKRRLSKFHQHLDGFDGLPELINGAGTFMGITTGGKGFSKDLLRVEITGPDRPHLTIVDLPGLIHSETKQQTASGVELVQNVVKSYMLKTGSVILAVVSAKNDFANQIVLKLARSADPGGECTLGVITKPDTLITGSGSEEMYLSLAKNKEVEFSPGWHVLKNLGFETHSGSLLLHQRNKEEAAFFLEGVWKTLPPSMLGIGELRNRLAELLPHQIAGELPSLVNEINAKLVSCRHELHQLGEPRCTPSEQRLLMLTVSQDFQRIVKSSVDGTYNGSFYESAESNRGYEQRIRAVVRNLNQDFADMLMKYGHKRQLSNGESGKEAELDNKKWADNFQKPEVVSQAQFIDHIQRLMERSRGTELPGQFNNTIGGDLFLEQSEP
ncbi:putative GED domain-containing protein [Seiridium cardinale]